MNDRTDSTSLDLCDPVGLCADCRHMRSVLSSRGSLFYLCQLSEIDPRFPKYPRLPVLRCRGYEQADEAKNSSSHQETGITS